jgi:hypothetical protein
MVDDLFPERPTTRALKFGLAFHHADEKLVVFTHGICLPDLASTNLKCIGMKTMEQG